MKMSRTVWIRVLLAVAIALAALFFIRLHNASGATTASAAAGHRLAEAWCKECHAIEAATIGTATPGPDFIKVASQTVDHGAFAEGVPSDQPPQHAEPHPQAG